MGPQQHTGADPEEVGDLQLEATWILVTSIPLFAVWPGHPHMPSPSLSVSGETSQRGMGLMTCWDWNRWGKKPF